MAPNMKQLIIKAFMSVTSTDNTSQFTNQWICDEGWFQILTHHIPSLKDALNINRANVIRSISSVAVPLKSEGEILIYHKIFQMECPYATSKRRHVHFFYRCTNARMPSDPTSPPQCAHALNAVPRPLIFDSAFIKSCNDVNNEIQKQTLGIKLSQHKNLDIPTLSSFEVDAVEFMKGGGGGRRGGAKR